MYCLRAKSGDSQALNELYRHNQYFIRKMCNDAFRQCGSPSTIEDKDLYQETAIGFMKAIEEYNPDSGFVFLTLAGNCIKNHVINYIVKQSYETRKKFPVKTQEIDYDELAGIKVKINPVDSDHIKSEPVYENDYHLTPEELYFRNHKKAKIYEALNELTARQRQYLNYRFVTDNHTREATAKHFGITIDEAVKTEKAALSQMRKRLIPEFAYIVNDKPERITADEAEEYITDRDYAAIYFELAKENNASTECEYYFIISEKTSETTGKIEIDFELGEYDSDVENTYTDELISALFYIYEDHGPLPNGVIILPSNESK
ncbi:MAG: sigma-70 family RNA polymerase sigma factor [Clostridia bacterium]|nr:sigma-70 family RNA polymerase sigma factor [Clostridia bacterium]